MAVNINDGTLEVQLPSPKDVRDNFVFSVAQGSESLIKINSAATADNAVKAKDFSVANPGRLVFFPENILSGSTSDVGLKITEIFSNSALTPVITDHVLGEETFEVKFRFGPRLNGTGNLAQQRISFDVDDIFGVQFCVGTAGYDNGQGITSTANSWHAAGSDIMSVGLKGIGRSFQFSPFRYGTRRASDDLEPGAWTFNGSYATNNFQVLNTYPTGAQQTAFKRFFGGSGADGDIVLRPREVGITWNNLIFYPTDTAMDPTGMEFRTYLVKHSILRIKEGTNTFLEVSFKANCVMRVV